MKTCYSHFQKCRYIYQIFLAVFYGYQHGALKKLKIGKYRFEPVALFRRANS